MPGSQGMDPCIIGVREVGINFFWREKLWSLSLTGIIWSIIQPSEHNFEHNVPISRVTPKSIMLDFTSINRLTPEPSDSWVREFLGHAWEDNFSPRASPVNTPDWEQRNFGSFSQHHARPLESRQFIWITFQWGTARKVYATACTWGDAKREGTQS